MKEFEASLRRGAFLSPGEVHGDESEDRTLTAAEGVGIRSGLGMYF